MAITINWKTMLAHVVTFQFGCQSSVAIEHEPWKARKGREPFLVSHILITPFS
uniref:Transposase n=1 Tax=Schistosoma curassoni TaxID=6186 RepID=A0A183JEC0_9TREM